MAPHLWLNEGLLCSQGHRHSWRPRCCTVNRIQKKNYILNSETHSTRPHLFAARLTPPAGHSSGETDQPWRKDLPTLTDGVHTGQPSKTHFSEAHQCQSCPCAKSFQSHFKGIAKFEPLAWKTELKTNKQRKESGENRQSSGRKKTFLKLWFMS